MIFQFVIRNFSLSTILGISLIIINSTLWRKESMKITWPIVLWVGCHRFITAWSPDICFPLDIKLISFWGYKGHFIFWSLPRQLKLKTCFIDSIEARCKSIRFIAFSYFLSRLVQFKILFFIFWIYYSYTILWRHYWAASLFNLYFIL